MTSSSSWVVVTRGGLRRAAGHQATFQGNSYTNNGVSFMLCLSFQNDCIATSSTRLRKTCGFSLNPSSINSDTQKVSILPSKWKN